AGGGLVVTDRDRGRGGRVAGAARSAAGVSTGEELPGKDDGEAVFDDGLQPERTALSWRRTGLALLGASSGAARVLPEILPVWTVVPAGLGIVISFGVLVAAHRRYRAVHAALTSSESAEMPLHGGGLPAVVAALVAAGGLGAMVVTVIKYMT
ncbi:MAG: DUF202 domain-containing protein, partial [Mycobacterium sp.]|nr:DUF202 domain-containing protein [Mycobacterium sp.]